MVRVVTESELVTEWSKRTTVRMRRVSSGVSLLSRR